jgi:hypothetical protein
MGTGVHVSPGALLKSTTQQRPPKHWVGSLIGGEGGALGSGGDGDGGGGDGDGGDGDGGGGDG